MEFQDTKWRKMDTYFRRYDVMCTECFVFVFIFEFDHVKLLLIMEFKDRK